MAFSLFLEHIKFILTFTAFPTCCSLYLKLSVVRFLHCLFLLVIQVSVQMSYSFRGTFVKSNFFMVHIIRNDLFLCLLACLFYIPYQKTHPQVINYTRAEILSLLFFVESLTSRTLPENLVYCRCFISKANLKTVVSQNVHKIFRLSWKGKY